VAFRQHAEHAAGKVNSGGFRTGSQIILQLEYFTASHATKSIDKIDIHSHGSRGGVIGQMTRVHGELLSGNDGLYADSEIPNYTAQWGPLSPDAARSSQLAKSILSGKIRVSKDASIRFFGCNTAWLAQQLSAQLSAGGRPDIKVTGSHGGARANPVNEENEAISGGKFGFITYEGKKKPTRSRNMSYK
jgi:hypothetical protein